MQRSAPQAGRLTTLARTFGNRSSRPCPHLPRDLFNFRASARYNRIGATAFPGPRSCRFQPDAEPCEERMMTMRKTLLSAAVAVLGLALPAARAAAADEPKIDFAKQ